MQTTTHSNAIGTTLTEKDGSMTLISRVWLKLRDKKYREEFVAAQARRAIPFQIRALMRKRQVSQQELAERSGLTQGVISRAANPAYGKLTLNTIIRVAAGLDVAFVGLFVPFSKLVDFYDRMSEERLANVLTFTEEDELIALEDREQDTSAFFRHMKRASNRTPRRETQTIDTTFAKFVTGQDAVQSRLPFAIADDQALAANLVRVPPQYRKTRTTSRSLRRMREAISKYRNAA
jgi:transcriptional regulator with XRE-family HTH domain